MTSKNNSKVLLMVIALFIFSILITAKPFIVKKPDLIITKISVNSSCNLVVTVKNVGPGVLPDSVYTDHHPKSAGVLVDINGKQWGGQSIWSFDNAKKLKNPGGTADCVLNYKVSKEIDVKAVVDKWNDVKEANENNNSSVKKNLACKTSPPGSSIFALSNIQFSPKSPVALNFNSKVNVSYNYTCADDVYIFVRPMTKGALTPGYSAHPSKLYPKGSGHGDGYFTVTSGKVTVDHVRFQMVDKSKNNVLLEKIVAVKYTFPKLSSPQPEGVIGASPVKPIPPKQFFLDFNDAYLVLTPASKSIQIVAQNCVLSYGNDWEICQLKPFLYHIKQNFWKGFYWKVNTSRKEVYEVTGGTFCQMGGNEKALAITVDVVGDSNSTPSRFFLRFKEARLVYITAKKTLQVITGDKVLLYGQDWEKCNFSINRYHLRQNVWKGFYWKIDTDKKKVWKINGTFCQPDSGGNSLNIGVRVIN